MKERRYFSGKAALAAAAVLCLFLPGLSAQGRPQAQPPGYPAQPQGPGYPGQAQPPGYPGQTQQPEQPSRDQQRTRKFKGKVMQLHSGKYALVTGKTSKGQLAGHFLDDPVDAKKFVGQEVAVIGKLNPATNTIHVSKIDPA